MDKKRILVVDDEEQIRIMYSQSLTKAGYEVKTVESAEEALQVIAETPYLVMFLDLNLPGMNGVELCRRIKKSLPAAIIHAVTGYASFYEITACREAGFDDYFTKPVSMNDLNEASELAFKKLSRWNTRM